MKHVNEREMREVTGGGYYCGNCRTTFSSKSAYNRHKFICKLQQIGWRLGGGKGAKGW